MHITNGLQAVISASFSASKPTAGDGDDDPKKRPHRKVLRQPAAPQSLAPWHTLPFMGREVISSVTAWHKARNISHLSS